MHTMRCVQTVFNKTLQTYRLMNYSPFHLFQCLVPFSLARRFLFFAVHGRRTECFRCAVCNERMHMHIEPLAASMGWPRWKMHIIHLWWNWCCRTQAIDWCGILLYERGVEYFGTSAFELNTIVKFRFRVREKERDLLVFLRLFLLGFVKYHVVVRCSAIWL